MATSLLALFQYAETADDVRSPTSAVRPRISTLGLAGHRPIFLLNKHSFPVEVRLGPKSTLNDGWRLCYGRYRRLQPAHGRRRGGDALRLKALRKTLVYPKIAEHRGRIVKTTGDGMLIEFASAVDAARCAVEVQRNIVGQNTDVPHENRIEFRIGIHVGDIIIDDNDIFGDGVNIAARLEGIAEPGGVCISDDAQRQIRGKVDIAFEDMGPQDLKTLRSRCASGVCRWPNARRLRRMAAGEEGSASGPSLTGRSSRCSLSEHERRSGAGVLRRRYGRGYHDRAVMDQVALRYRPQLVLPTKAEPSI